jgi:L-methionine (R)-S-oxide reductase
MLKAEAYRKIIDQISALIEGEKDLIAVMSTVSCEIFHGFDEFNWVGFYRKVDERTLKVGPYQGGHGCLTIDRDRGVCGACFREGVLQLENDVSKASSHIACSSTTKSELVLPIVNKKSEVVAVLDIDSTQLGVFDEVDVKALEQICAWVSERYC